jgi:hypothetical protein
MEAIDRLKGWAICVEGNQVLARRGEIVEPIAYCGKLGSVLLESEQKKELAEFIAKRIKQEMEDK